MNDYNLTAGSNSIGLEPTKTVGICTLNWTTNQTRTTEFDPAILIEWAHAVQEAFNHRDSVEIVFTPGKPIAARTPTDDGFDESIAIAFGPRIADVDVAESDTTRDIPLDREHHNAPKDGNDDPVFEQ